MNSPVIFLAKRTKVHPSFRSNNLVTIHGFTEGSCAITYKESYMDDETWAKVVKVVSPGIIKTKVNDIACVLPILFSTYLTIYLCL